MPALHCHNGSCRYVCAVPQSNFSCPCSKLLRNSWTDVFPPCPCFVVLSSCLTKNIFTAEKLLIMITNLLCSNFSLLIIREESFSRTNWAKTSLSLLKTLRGGLQKDMLGHGHLLLFALTIMAGILLLNNI